MKIKYPIFAFLMFGVITSIAWHFSLLGLSPFPLFENADHLKRLLMAYTASYILIASLVVFFAYADCHVSVFLKIITCGYIACHTARAVDWINVYYYGAHIDVLFWENAFHMEGVDMLLTKPAIISILATAVMAAAFHYLISCINHEYRKRSEQGIAMRTYVVRQCIFPMLAFALIALGINQLLIEQAFSTKIRSAVYTQHLPEYQFVRSIQNYLKSDRAPEIALSDQQKNKLERMGLQLESISSEYPLLKESIFIGDRNRLAKSESNPNVIVIMVESLSSYLLENQEIQSLNITPFLDDFSKQSLSYTNIVNANTPTLQGQIATIASSLHLYKPTLNRLKRAKHTEVSAQFSDQDDPLITNYSFLPKLLKAHGYLSTHIQGGDPNFAKTERYFRMSAKYDDFICSADDQYSNHRAHRIGHWGASDADTFSLATRWMQSIEHAPFFLTISTIDIHHPYTPPIKKAGIDNGLLNSIYSTDFGFGIFWEYFKTSNYKDNTIVIVTADHALFPSSEYLALRGGTANYYDKIPLLIYSPFHKDLMLKTDDTLGSSLDIAPTLLELLEIDAKNSFLGLSLLSERKNYPHLLGRINLTSKYSRDNSLNWTDDDHDAFLGYLKYLAYKNRLYPPTYHKARERRD